MSDDNIKIVTQNRKARHDYTILDTMEAGLALQGTEVKSLRAGSANLKDCYARVENGEVFLYNFHVSPYDKASWFNHDPLRVKKLLLHRKEIRKLTGKIQEKGLTLVALKVYFKGGKAKVELAIGRGKKLHDRRDDLAERDAKRAIARAMRKKM
jgi:SsrA-binding protein